ncbi:MAG: prepilin-type N-terminal cleavage/methylation domain-containing protein [Pirellulales bacterium]|nr:prepilin-type N-terminal cleavage/methylation domain-containing protein [Pirellulales bacterium]
MQPPLASPCREKTRREKTCREQKSARPGATRIPGKLGRRAFTLVELLVVLTIIGILVALVGSAVASALTTAREARVLAEISGLDTALTTYKTDHGVPPDFSPYDGVSWISAEPGYAAGVFVKHLNRRFSSSVIFDYTSVEVGIRGAYPAPTPSGGLEVSLLDPAEALVFWLGGFPVGGRLTGFNADKSAPLNPGGSRTSPLYDFDETRLKDQDNDGWPEYYPDADLGPAYVYFASRGDGSYGTIPAYNPANIASSGFAVPYLLPNGSPVNDRTYQIIAGGVRDNSYAGTNTGPRTNPPIWKSGLNFLDGDFDNLTNFHSGSLDKGLD